MQIMHGGCLATFSKMFPSAPRPWLDLSTGINPIPYPTVLAERPNWACLPQTDTLTALRVSAAQAYHCAPADIVIAPGTQAIIGALPYLLKAKHAVIQSPTYTGHAESWLSAGRACTDTQRIDPENISSNCCYVICRPNNPDGHITQHAKLRALAQAAKANGSTLVVDASFADFECNEPDMFLDNPAVIVLRSFGKTYGLAGVRLGFALGCHPALQRLEAIFGPWPVTTFAARVGAKALNDAAWRNAAHRHLANQTAQLQNLMCNAGFSVVGSTCLFSLFYHPHAESWWSHFARHGIATRNFASTPTWLRLGTPADADALQRVRNAMQTFV